MTDGVGFTFPAIALDAEGESRRQRCDRFEERYGALPDFELDGGSFSSGGETIRSVDATTTTVDVLASTDDPPWPGVADGGGPSSERFDLALPDACDDSDASNRRASFAPFGTPGEVDPSPRSSTAPSSSRSTTAPSVLRTTPI